MVDLDRRSCLADIGMGVAGLAVHAVLCGEARSDSMGRSRMRDLAAKADTVIWLFMMGGVSHVEGFDPKPALNRYAGKTIGETPARRVLRTGLDQQEFGPEIGHDTRILPLQVGHRPRGESGTLVSDWWEHVGGCIDDIAVVRSMWTTDTEHSAVFQFHTGRTLRQEPQPSLGAWCTYGLGLPRDNLPQFVVMGTAPQTHQGGPKSHFGGYLGQEYDGVAVEGDHETVLPYPPRPDHGSPARRRREFDFVQGLNAAALRERPEDGALRARIAAYETAFRMQSSLPECVDLRSETQETHSLYGIDDPECGSFGRQCLVARRLAERGVRFVQVYHGGSRENDNGMWDAHEDLKGNHSRMCRSADRPIAGLLRDLKRRGMLDRTLVVWATEFGRTPNIDIRTPCGPMDQNVRTGRDHHIYGFSVWLAGGGVKRGIVHGATDELGFHAVEGRRYVTDLHATVLHLLGIDPYRLEFGGRQRLKMDKGSVISEIIA